MIRRLKLGIEVMMVMLLMGFFAPGVVAADPDAPTIFHPVDNAVVDDLSPTLYAYYSDPDGGDTGFTEYFVSTGTAGDCLANLNPADSGSSTESTTTNEVTSYVVGVALTDTATYNWCARNFDGNTYSAWTTMGSFTVYNTLTLLGSTYLGTSDDDYGEAVGILPNGEVVVISRVSSSSFPTTGGVLQPTDPSVATRLHPAISVFNEALTSLLRSTYLGGSTSDDYLRDGDVDDNGNIYLTGTSYSSDLPQSGILTGFDTTPDTNCGDTFLLKVNSALSTITFSTYIGGTDAVAVAAGEDCEVMGGGMAVHPTSGLVMVVSNTSSESLPLTPNAFDTTPDGPSNSWDQDMYIAFVDTTTSGPSSNVFLSYLGDSFVGEWSYQEPYMDENEIGYVGIEVYGNFSQTTPGAYETTYPNSGTDTVFVKIDPYGTALTSLAYASFIEDSSPYAMHTDSEGNIYILGDGYGASLFVTPGAWDTTPSGSGDCFIYKIDPSGNGAADLLAATYVPVCDSMKIDDSNFVYFTGQTTDAAVPTTPNAFRSAFVGGASRSGYVGKLNADLNSLDYGSYYGIQGTNGIAYFNGSALDGRRGSYYVSGEAFPQLTADPTIFSPDVTSGAYDETQNDARDIFVARFILPSDPIVPGPVTSAPSAIIDLSAIAGSEEVDLMWSAPADGGDPITDYVIQFGATAGFPGNAAVFPDGVSTTTSTTVTGLTNGTDYSFIVSAVNGTGTAPDSNVATATPLATAGGRRGRTNTTGGPQFFLGRVMEVFSLGDAQTTAGDDAVLRGSAEGQEHSISSLMLEFGQLDREGGQGSVDELFSDASRFPGLNSGQRAQLVKLLDLIVALRRLFHWVYMPDGYDLLPEHDVLARQYRMMFLTRDFHQKVGLEYLMTQGEGVYDFEYRQDMMAPTDIVAFFMRSILLSFGKSCYPEEVLRIAESFDRADNPYWFEGYVDVMKPWMDEVLKTRGYQLWRTTSDINVLDAVYLFLYGFCFEPELS